MIRKIGLYFLSLWLLFFLIIVLTVDFPTCLEEGWKSYLRELLLGNTLPLCCLVPLGVGGAAFYDFKFRARGTTSLSFELSKVENIEHEHLAFLTTYIIPLVCFNFEDFRSVLVFSILLVVIGVIYVRTDLFYANPILALLNFRIYRISGIGRDGTEIHAILITRDELREKDYVRYIRLDSKVFYAYKN